MFEGQLLAMFVDALYTSVHFGCTMDDWRPVCLVLTKEAENVVRIVAAHKSSHKVVLAWNDQSVGTVGFADALV